MNVWQEHAHLRAPVVPNCMCTVPYLGVSNPIVGLLLEGSYRKDPLLFTEAAIWGSLLAPFDHRSLDSLSLRSGLHTRNGAARRGCGWTLRHRLQVGSGGWVVL